MMAISSPPPSIVFSFTSSFPILSQFLLFPSLHPVTPVNPVTLVSPSPLSARSLIPITPLIPLIPILSIISISRFNLADLSRAACKSDVPRPLKRQIRSSQLYAYDTFIWQFPQWEIINDVNNTCLNCSSLGEEVLQPGKASSRTESCEADMKQGVLFYQGNTYIKNVGALL